MYTTCEQYSKMLVVGGEVYIHGESDCVTYATLPSIEHFMGGEIGLAFKK